MRVLLFKGIFILFCLLIVIPALCQKDADTWIAKKDQFKPAGDIYPQIIQNEDVHLVGAVTKWGEALEIFGETDFKKPNHLTCLLDKDTITVTSGKKSITIHVRKNSVVIGKKAYSDEATLVYFQTLLHLLTGISKDFKCQDVKYLEFSNTVEETRMVIEFDYAPLVVSIDSELGKDGNGENHNFLDLVTEKDSFFWGK